MPYYKYRCKDCYHELEVQQKMAEAPLTVCPQCSKEALARVIPDSIGIAFKGQGFYKTDSRANKEKKTEACSTGKCPAAIEN